MPSTVSDWDEIEYPPLDIRRVAQAIAMMWCDELRKLDDIQAYRIRIPAAYNGPNVQERVGEILKQYDQYRSDALKSYQLQVQELIARMPGPAVFRRKDDV